MRKTIDVLKVVFLALLIFSILSRFLHLYVFPFYNLLPIVILLAIILLHIRQEQLKGYLEDPNDDFSL